MKSTRYNCSREHALGSKIWIKFSFKKHTRAIWVRRRRRRRRKILLLLFQNSIQARQSVSESTRSATRRGDACKCLWKVNICDVGVWKRDEQQIDKYHDPKKNTKPHVVEALEDHVQRDWIIWCVAATAEAAAAAPQYVFFSWRNFAIFEQRNGENFWGFSGVKDSANLC